MKCKDCDCNKTENKNTGTNKYPLSNSLINKDEGLLKSEILKYAQNLFKDEPNLVLDFYDAQIKAVEKLLKVLSEPKTKETIHQEIIEKSLKKEELDYLITYDNYLKQIDIVNKVTKALEDKSMDSFKKITNKKEKR